MEGEVAAEGEAVGGKLLSRGAEDITAEIPVAVEEAASGEEACWRVTEVALSETNGTRARRDTHAADEQPGPEAESASETRE